MAFFILLCRTQAYYICSHADISSNFLAQSSPDNQPKHSENIDSKVSGKRILIRRPRLLGFLQMVAPKFFEFVEAEKKVAAPLCGKPRSRGKRQRKLRIQFIYIIYICILLRESVRISLEECVLRVHPLNYAEYVEPEECGDADEGDSATRGHKGKVDRLFK